MRGDDPEAQATEWFGTVPPKDWKNVLPMPAETAMKQPVAPDTADSKAALV